MSESKATEKAWQKYNGYSALMAIIEDVPVQTEEAGYVSIREAMEKGYSFEEALLADGYVLLQKQIKKAEEDVWVEERVDAVKADSTIRLALTPAELRKEARKVYREALKK